MPLLWLSVAFMTGLVLAAGIGLHWGIWAGLAGGCILCAAFEHRLAAIWNPLERWRCICPLPLAAVLAALFLGALRWQAAQPVITPSDLAWYNGRGEYILTGWIDSPPERRERSSMLRLRVEKLVPADGSGVAVAVKGELLVRLPPNDTWQYGQRLELTGFPAAPSQGGDFSYAAYLARQGVYSQLIYPRVHLLEGRSGSLMLKGIYAFRQRAYATLNRILPQPEAGLLSGVLLGIESDLPADLVEAFQTTGTAHIVAISGFNIAVLAGLFSAFALRLLPRRWGWLAALAGISFYTIMVGAQAPVVRAAIMGGLGLLAAQLGRRQSGVNSLAFSGAVMCIFEPDLPWDVAFQLTFAATLGLVLFAEPLQTWFVRLAERRLPADTARRLAGPVGEYFLFTLAAQVFTLPVLAWHFGRISFSSLLANPLILPAQPIAMILGGAAVLAGMLLPAAGQLLGWLAWVPLAYTIHVVEVLEPLPGGSIAVGAGAAWLAGTICLLVLGLTVFRRWLAWLQKHVKPVALLISAALLAGFAARAALAAPDGRLHINLLNVADGPAVFVQAPHGNTLLLGGSSSGRELGDALGRRLSPLHRQLDALVLPENHAAPLQGLPDVLGRYPAGLVLWNGEVDATLASERLDATLRADGTTLSSLEAGAVLDLGGGARLVVLAVDGEEAVLLLEYGGFRMLLPGSLPAEALPPGTLPVDGVSAVLLTNPGNLDWDGLETGLTLAPAPAQGAINWLDWRDCAWVELVTDGTRLWVEVGR